MFNILIMLVTICLILGIAFLLSDNKSNINKRTVLVGLTLQGLLTLFVLKTPIGAKILETIALNIQNIANFGLEGVSFVWGDLTGMNVFFVNVLCLIIFMSALIAVLQYLGVIPFLVKHLGGFLAKVLGTNKAETFNAVANLIMGQTESPLMIKPFFKGLSESELFSVMVSGMGSASFAILVGYSAMGIPMEYLLIAVFTSMFSSLIIAKIMKPNTTKDDENVEVVKSDASNIFDAIGQGTMDGLNMVLAIMASLIAFVGLIALVNGILGLVGTSLTEILTIVFTPVAWLFNIPKADVSAFASLLGTKLTVNEFVAFTSMSELVNTMNPRTVAILAVSLCNFANFSSIGIQLGGLSSIAPEQRPNIAKLGLKALIGATLATLLSGALVGLMF